MRGGKSQAFCFVLLLLFLFRNSGVINEQFREQRGDEDEEEEQQQKHRANETVSHHTTFFIQWRRNALPMDLLDTNCERMFSSFQYAVGSGGTRHRATTIQRCFHLTKGIITKILAPPYCLPWTRVLTLPKEICCPFFIPPTSASSNLQYYRNSNN